MPVTMFVPEEDEPPLPAARRSSIPITDVTRFKRVPTDVIDLFESVRAESPINESWPEEAVKACLETVLHDRVHPLFLQAWGTYAIGATGKLVGLLTGFQLTPPLSERLFGMPDVPSLVADAFRHEAEGGLMPVGTHVDVGYVQDLLVPASVRGKRIGTALLTAAFARFRERGIPFVTLRVRTGDPFAVACLRNGWKSIGQMADRRYLGLARHI